jgi:hypothetical protein
VRRRDRRPASEAEAAPSWPIWEPPCVSRAALRPAPNRQSGAGSTSGVAALHVALLVCPVRPLTSHIRRYLKSVSDVYDVAGRAFKLRRRRVILSGVHDAPGAVSHV